MNQQKAIFIILHYLAYWELYVESFKGTLQLIFHLWEWESPGIIV